MDNNLDYDKEQRFSYGYKEKGGWDIDTSDKTQRESDSGHIPGRYQLEETIDVSADDDDNDNDEDGDDKN